MNVSKQIPLTRGMFATVDDEDYEYLSQWKWFAHTDNSGYTYAMRSTKRPDGAKAMLYMHRAILRDQLHGGLLVDHINGAGLDNRRANLRVATRSQNAQNAKRPITNTTGVKGVSFNREKARYEVRFRHNKQQHFGGYFDTIDAATDTYRAAAAMLHQEFARFE